MILEQPKMLEWWNDMEVKYGEGEYTFFRKNKSAVDLVELSKRNFRKSTDEHETNKQQMTMFDAELDIEYDCFCKST
jgi:hypothetical protein